PGEYLVTAMPRESGLSDNAIADMKMQVAAAAGTPAADELRKTLESQVLALTESNSDSGYAPVYYPSTLTPSSATTVTLDISEEKPAIDIPLQVVPLQRVTGTVAAPDGPLPQGVSVTLVDATGFVPGLPQRSARVNPDGRFTLSGVPPGQ